MRSMATNRSSVAGRGILLVFSRSKRVLLGVRSPARPSLLSSVDFARLLGVSSGPGPSPLASLRFVGVLRTPALLLVRDLDSAEERYFRLLVEEEESLEKSIISCFGGVWDAR